MRKLFAIFCLLALTLGFMAGEKRVVGTKINNQIMLLRVDLANYSMDASTDGVNWSAIPGTSGEFVINDNDLSLAKLVQIPTASILGNVSGSTGNVTALSASDIKTLIGDATTSVSGLMSASDKTALGTRAASGANSDITSLSGLTTALSVAQGGTGLSSLGAAGQVLTVNSGATGYEFTTPSSGGIDLSSYGAADNGHYARFSYASGGIDENASACFHFDSALTDAAGHITGGTVTGTTAYSAGKFGNAFSFDGSTNITYSKNQIYDGFLSSEKVTCDFWIKTTDTSASGAAPMSKNGYGENRFYFYLRNGVMSFEVYEGSWVSFAIGSVSNGEWHHVALTYDGATSALKTYLDGTLITSATHAISSSEGSEGFIFGNYGFIGQIDEFRFSKGIIRWTENFTPPDVAYSSSTTRMLYVDSTALSNATTSSAGLMSSSDKVKLDGLPSSAIAAPASPAQGDVLYYTGSAWSSLVAGTSGQYLQTQGSGANPQWATVSGATGGLLLASGSGYALENGSTGRGTIGTKSVSLEYSDSGSTYGATGDFSATGGGKYNTASGGRSVVSGGFTNTASGDGASVSGGYSNTASGGYSSVSGGYSNTVSGGYSSVTGGTEAIASHLAENAISSGKFSSIGDCQRGSVQARIATSSTDAAILYLDNSSVKFTLSAGDHYSCRIHVIGAQTDGSTGDYYALVKIKNVSGTTSLSGTVRVLEAWESDANLGTPTIAITADDTNDCLQIAVTPANATATRWSATVEYIKINY